MNTSDFGTSLLNALRDAQHSADDSKLFFKAALALRAWYRHEALCHKPELVVQCTADVCEVYGSAKIRRLPDGSLQLEEHQQILTPLYYIEVCSIGRWLAGTARSAIQKEYLAKAEAFIRLNAADEREYLAANLASIHNFVVEKLNVNWWRPKCTLADDARVLGRLMWDAGLLDREIFGLARRVAGFGFSATLYNECCQHREALKARVKEAPHMAPWLLNHTFNGDRLRVHPTVWKDLKEEFLSKGGAPQAWKWLCNQGYSWFRFTRLTESCVSALNGLASLQLGKVPLSPTLVGLVYTRYPELGWQVGEPRLLDVFKAAIVAYKKRKVRLAELNDCTLILDYLEDTPKANTKGATWASLLRKQQAWHREKAKEAMLRRKEEGGCLGWAPIIQVMQLNDLEAISLNNSDDLWEEGSLMQHCVGGYDSRCYENQSRIYSIRRDGNREATLEIRLVDGKWTIGQLYGPHNTAIKAKDVNLFANKILAACKKAPALNPADNHVIRQPKRSDAPKRRKASRAEVMAARPVEVPAGEVLAGDDYIPF